MIQNLGTVDRLVRVAIGLVLLALIFILDGGQRWLGLIGLIPLVTGTFSFCPLYRMIGLNTCPRP